METKYQGPDGSIVFIKQEPSTSDSNFYDKVCYCRCCFKMLHSSEFQQSCTKLLLQALQDITELILEPHPLAASFCYDCFNSICSLQEFKKLAIMKQQMFNEMVKSNLWSMSEIHGVKSTLDPLPSHTNYEGGAENFVKAEVMCEDFAIDAPESPQPEVPSTSSTRGISKRPSRSHRKRVYKKDAGICPFCGQLKQCLRKHIHAVHEKIKKFFCDMCGYSACEKRYVVEHMLAHLPKGLECPRCNFRTSTNKYLLKHIANRHNPKDESVEVPKFPCHECSSEFKSIYNLNGHILRKHQKIEKFNCDVCMKGFFARSDLKTHKTNVHGTKSVVCDVCGSAFVSQKRLEEHLVTHTDVRFNCHLCHMQFLKKQQINNHIKRVHLQIRDHECKICHKRFFRGSLLKTHMNGHLGIKFKCYVPGCATSVSRRDFLVSHMKSRHQLTNEEREAFMEKLNAYSASIRNSEVPA